MSFDKQHLRHCLLFAFHLRKNAAEAQEIICSALGDDAVSYSTCKKWFQKFKNGNFDLEDEERSGHPKKVEDEELEQLLEENPCQTQSELAEALKVTQQAVSKRLHKLGRVQKEGSWVPHVLSPENKERRCDIALSLLSRFKRKDFLHKIITCDEKWVLYDNPKRRKSWVYPGKPSAGTAKSNIRGKKVLLCIWWDQKGVIYYELLKPGETVSAERYQQQLIRVSDALEEKRPFTGSGKRQVILLQDNARPHTAKTTLRVIADLGWEILPHTEYSPDLAPSDYYIFWSLQHHLADTHHRTPEEVRQSIDDFIDSKQPSFFQSGIRQLPIRWQKCVESEGDYFQAEQALISDKKNAQHSDESVASEIQNPANEYSITAPEKKSYSKDYVKNSSGQFEEQNVDYTRRQKSVEPDDAQVEGANTQQDYGLQGGEKYEGQEYQNYPAEYSNQDYAQYEQYDSSAYQENPSREAEQLTATEDVAYQQDQQHYEDYPTENYPDNQSQQITNNEPDFAKSTTVESTHSET